MWNPFKKKDPLEGQRANYALAFDIVIKSSECIQHWKYAIDRIGKRLNFHELCR